MSGRVGGAYQGRKRRASKELSEDEGDKPPVGRRKLAEGKEKASKELSEDERERPSVVKRKFAEGKQKASKELSEDERARPSVVKRKHAVARLFKGDVGKTKTSKGKPKAGKKYSKDELSEADEDTASSDEDTSSDDGAGGRLESLIEVIANDRLGHKVRVKCSPRDTVGDLKLLIAAQIGTKGKKIVLKKANIIFKDHIQLDDYEIHDGMSMEMYYG